MLRVNKGEVATLQQAKRRFSSCRGNVGFDDVARKTARWWHHRSVREASGCIHPIK